MKTLNLTSHDVKEIDETQMSDVNGGSLAGFGIVLGVICLVAYCVDNREKFVEGVKEGYNAVVG